MGHRHGRARPLRRYVPQRRVRSVEDARLRRGGGRDRPLRACPRGRHPGARRGLAHDPRPGLRPDRPDRLGGRGVPERSRQRHRLPTRRPVRRPPATAGRRRGDHRRQDRDRSWCARRDPAHPGTGRRAVPHVRHDHADRRDSRAADRARGRLHRRRTGQRLRQLRLGGHLRPPQRGDAARPRRRDQPPVHPRLRAQVRGVSRPRHAGGLRGRRRHRVADRRRRDPG